MKITIPDIPPSLNEFVGRKNEHKYRAEKEAWTNAVYIACRAAKAKPITGKASKGRVCTGQNIRPVRS